MKWSMEKWQAVVIAILFLCLFYFLPLPVAFLFVILSALWASFDAGKLGTRNYSSNFLPVTPGGIFIGCLLLWIVFFPGYLYFRSKVKAGLAREKSKDPITSDCYSDLEKASSPRLPDLIERD